MCPKGQIREILVSRKNLVLYSNVAEGYSISRIILYEVPKISVIQSDIRALPRIDYGFIQVAPPWGKQIMHLKLCIWLYWVIQ